ncbi:MAG TPA: hypothetical protein DIT25_03625 [Candidatus Moranbacteria bacterium]|nr:hypothetical protein [Candidatus Moranbacteria bacterium]
MLTKNIFVQAGEDNMVRILFRIDNGILSLRVPHDKGSFGEKAALDAVAEVADELSIEGVIFEGLRRKTDYGKAIDCVRFKLPLSGEGFEEQSSATNLIITGSFSADEAPLFLKDMNDLEAAVGTSIKFYRNACDRWSVALKFQNKERRALFIESLRDGVLQKWRNRFMV